jgi:hypothetical protein
MDEIKNIIIQYNLFVLKNSIRSANEKNVILSKIQWFILVNPCYLGGRDREDHSLRLAWEKLARLSSQ